MNIKHLKAIYSLLKKEKNGALNITVAEKLGIANSTSSKYLQTLCELKLLNSERGRCGNVYSLKPGVTFDKAVCNSCNKTRKLSRINQLGECFVCSHENNIKRRRVVASSKVIDGYQPTTDMKKKFDGEHQNWDAVLLIAKNRKINRLQMSI